MVSTASPHETAHLRDRVRLYLQVMLVIDVGAYVSDVVTPLFLDDLKYPEWPLAARILRWGVTVALFAGWLFAKLARPSRPTLIALESGFTIGLVLVYIHMSEAYFSGVQPAYGPVFALIGIVLLPIEKVGEQTVARFEREVQQTSRLEHPNSVSIYDYGRTPDGQFYYAMEYLDGVTLEQLVHMDGPISAARAALVLRQAASALAEAHAMGLVHRDIKPANIMLCERAQVPDTVKVLDFGLVKAIDGGEVDDNITMANAVVGTPHYLAPEWREFREGREGAVESRPSERTQLAVKVEGRR